MCRRRLPDAGPPRAPVAHVWRTAATDSTETDDEPAVERRTRKVEGIGAGGDLRAGSNARTAGGHVITLETVGGAEGCGMCGVRGPPAHSQMQPHPIAPQAR